MRRRVVVTGLGLVTPLGADLERVWERMLAGDGGIGGPGTPTPPVAALGRVPPDVLEGVERAFPHLRGRADRRTVFGAAAAEAAIEHAGLRGDPGGGMALGTGPGVHRLEDLDRWLDADGRLDALRMAREVERASADGVLRTGAEDPAVVVARRLGLRGPVSTHSTACAASLQAVGAALRAVRGGRAEWMVAGGADSMMDPVGLVYFALLRAAAVSDGDPAAACRPFDVRRSGLVVGEGAGFVVLESLEHARARGAAAWAEAAGYGSSFDAHRTTAPRPDGRGAAQAMASALRDAAMAPDEVDFVNAHGTGTRRNDPVEARAIHAVFGARTPQVAVSSGKSMMGHMLAAAGGAALVASVLAVARDRIPPTIHCTHPDPECALDLVRGTARATRVRAALTNAFAFGGQCTSVAVRKAAP